MSPQEVATLKKLLAKVRSNLGEVPWDAHSQQTVGAAS
jgi:hypothetical protein